MYPISPISTVHRIHPPNLAEEYCVQDPCTLSRRGAQCTGSMHLISPRSTLHRIRTLKTNYTCVIAWHLTIPPDVIRQNQAKQTSACNCYDNNNSNNIHAPSHTLWCRKLWTKITITLFSWEWWNNRCNSYCMYEYMIHEYMRNYSNIRAQCSFHSWLSNSPLPGCYKVHVYVMFLMLCYTSVTNHWRMITHIN